VIEIGSIGIETMDRHPSPSRIAITSKANRGMRIDPHLPSVAS
jgi:hypothetical protein